MYRPNLDLIHAFNVFIVSFLHNVTGDPPPIMATMTPVAYPEYYPHDYTPTSLPPIGAIYQQYLANYDASLQTYTQSPTQDRVCFNEAMAVSTPKNMSAKGYESHENRVETYSDSSQYAPSAFQPYHGTIISPIHPTHAIESSRKIIRPWEFSPCKRTAPEDAEISCAIPSAHSMNVYMSDSNANDDSGYTSLTNIQPEPVQAYSPISSVAHSPPAANVCSDPTGIPQTHDAEHTTVKQEPAPNVLPSHSANLDRAQAKPVTPQPESNVAEKSSKESKPTKGKRALQRRPLSAKAVKILDNWYSAHAKYPYPSSMETEDLAREGEISVAQVKKWLANKRVRSFNTLSFSGSIHPKRLQRLRKQQEALTQALDNHNPTEKAVHDSEPTQVHGNTQVAAHPYATNNIPYHYNSMAVHPGLTSQPQAVGYAYQPALPQNHQWHTMPPSMNPNPVPIPQQTQPQIMYSPHPMHSIPPQSFTPQEMHSHIYYGTCLPQPNPKATHYNEDNKENIDVDMLMDKEGRFSTLGSHAVSVLKAWYRRNANSPYPSQEEKEQLAASSGLSLSQVNCWFTNRRRRQKTRKTTKEPSKGVRASSRLHLSNMR